jgi:hypothetical protein
MQDKLSYVRIANHPETNTPRAKVTCLCGWESDTFQVGPFDPAEALVAYSVEHLMCKEKTELAAPAPEIFYGIAHNIHGKMTPIGDLSKNRALFEKAAEGLSVKGRPMYLIEVKILKTYEG